MLDTVGVSQCAALSVRVNTNLKEVKMNTIQRRIIIGGLLVVLAMILFPPMNGNGLAVDSARGQFREVTKTAYRFVLETQQSRLSIWEWEVAYGRLSLQLLAVMCVTAILVVYTHGKESKAKDAHPVAEKELV